MTVLQVKRLQVEGANRWETNASCIQALHDGKLSTNLSSHAWCRNWPDIPKTCTVVGSSWTHNILRKITWAPAIAQAFAASEHSQQVAFHLSKQEESTGATVEQEDVDDQDMRNTQGRDPKAMVQQGTRQGALAQTP